MTVDDLEQVLELALYGYSSKALGQGVDALLKRAVQEKEAAGVKNITDRMAAVRVLAIILTPPEKPDPQKLMIELLARIWNAPEGVLKFQFVDLVYPADVINPLLREQFISRSMSGYFLMPKGFESLKAYGKEHNDNEQS